MQTDLIDEAVLALSEKQFVTKYLADYKSNITKCHPKNPHDPSEAFGVIDLGGLILCYIVVLIVLVGCKIIRDVRRAIHHKRHHGHSH